jgi:hypothetical protein
MKASPSTSTVTALAVLVAAGLLVVPSTSGAGDVRWRDHNRTARDRRALTLRVHVDPTRLARRRAWFGVPKPWLQPRFSGSADLRRKVAELKTRALAHGMAIDLVDGVLEIGVAHDRVVSESLDDLHALTRDLLALAKREGYRDLRAFIGLIASFVQSFTYIVPPDEHRGPEGETIVTTGAWAPIETLHRRAGDCDSLSLLFASALKRVRHLDVVFFAGGFEHDPHLFVGVGISPRPGDAFVEVRGRPYVLLEMTDAWPLGRADRRHRAILAGRSLRVIPIGGGQ